MTAATIKLVCVAWVLGVATGALVALSAAASVV